jgi:lysophospholipase L1-like esterase
MAVIRAAVAWGLAALAIVGQLAAQRAAPTGQAAIALRSGDRIAFIGGAFIEREYRFGVIETALTLAHPDKGLTFRNLGWSGDTVRGEARAYFGDPADGYKALLASVAEVQPSVVFLAYGGNEAFAGEDALPAFVAQYERLLADLAAPDRRLVLLTPLPTGAATSPLPPPAVEARHRTLAHYAKAILSLANSRGLASIDLFAAIDAAGRAGGPPLFANGHDLTEPGYLVAARHIAGRTAPARSLQPSREPWARVRALIVEKNELFFHRWRPANVTYLYLFRQREQGTNAAEIPRFDPLIAEKERAIAELASALGPAPQEPR